MKKWICPDCKRGVLAPNGCYPKLHTCTKPLLKPNLSDGANISLKRAGGIDLGAESLKTSRFSGEQK